MQITIGEFRQLINEVLLSEVFIRIPSIEKFKSDISGLKGDREKASRVLSRMKSTLPQSLYALFQSLSMQVLSWCAGRKTSNELESAIDKFYGRLDAWKQFQVQYVS